MKIQIFANGKGLIYGTDSKRIGCDIAGTLTIGVSKISISPGVESVMPVLFNGCTGIYNATFTSIIGNVYELENVSVKGGRIVPPSETSIALMELRCKYEALETEMETIKERILELSNIFDTDSLNFLIK